MKPYEEVCFPSGILRWIREGDEYVCRLTEDQMNEIKQLHEKPWVKTYSGGKPNYTQPIEQEPAAWGVDEGEGRCISLHDLYFVKEDADHMAELKGTHAKVVALYTAPTKKEWVGLTDEQKKEICQEAANEDWTDLDVINATEAKLREKNG